MDDLPHQGLGAKHLSLSSAHWSTRLRYTAPQKTVAHLCYRREREGEAVGAGLAQRSAPWPASRAGRGTGEREHPLL